ncbi:hypothetical protein RND81_12G229200 [Saponaria officinalis]|uniref:Photosynthetic NDH subunit of lumenal location 3, chloroplastic n=1 Tax=Saponaria officinalis TaxID=3572 RepID=A0AAW1HEA6_SAPOF
MATLSNLHGIIETLPFIPNLQNIQKRPTKSCKFQCHAKNLDDFDSNVQCVLPSNTTRRSLLGIASITLLAQFDAKTSLAEEGNGLWLDGPLPGLPPLQNTIGNKETGTRSFLKAGLYMANIGVTGSAYRLKKYAFDLMALGDLIGQDAWNYFRKYLKIKATFMYYDFDKLISAASVTDKQPLTDLANRLFDNFEQLLDAVKMKDLPLTESRYHDTTVILQEVMDRMA